MNEIPEGKLESVAHLLSDIGIPKNAGKALAYLILKGAEAKTVEIEIKTGLRQPEVSIAIKYLRKFGWLSKSEIKKEIKGRPVHLYTLSMPLEKLIAEFEKIQQKKISVLEESLTKLRQELITK